MEKNELIRVEDLNKTYSYYKNAEGLKGTIKKLFVREKLYNEAVKNISFSINKGELIGFIGPNGAGKTTVLKMLSGILYPTSGKIDVMGFEPFKRKHAFLKKISIVMGQKSQLWWDLPARDTFDLYKKMYSISDGDYKSRLNYFAKELEVEEQLDVQVRKLSLGQRMKMELIASLLYNPEILLLDEPTIGLDIKSQKTIRKFVKEYNEKHGNTIILTSHYMKDVQELCDRIIIIDHGNINFDGKQSELMDKYTEDKLINICFSEVPNKNILDSYGKVISVKENEVKIKVPKNDSAKIIGSILNSYEVMDINIEEPGLEDIMDKIF